MAAWGSMGAAAAVMLPPPLLGEEPDALPDDGYKPLGGEAISTSALSPELSGHGGHTDGFQPVSRSNTMVPTKSFGDLKAFLGRARGKKTRAMRWLVLRASGERQVFTLDKRQLIQTCRLEIPMRDMRLMDSALGTETLAQLLVRDNALVFSMEHVRLIIMHDKVVVPLDDGGLQPPAPPSAAPERPTSAATPELKDRFLNHLEGVVMDWALQHGSTIASTAAPPPLPPLPPTAGPTTTVSNGGLAHPPALVSFCNQPTSQPPQQPSPASGITPHQQSQQQQHVSVAAQSGGGAAASAQSHPEPHICSKAVSLRNGGGGGPAGGGAAVLSAAVAAAAAAAAAPPSVSGPGSETASTNAFDPEYQPFEMLVLETALTEICTHLSREVDALQVNCQPALEALMKTADTANLEAVRRVKTQHARLVTRVTATREALERLMEDDDDMVRMCLTQQAHMRLAAVAAAAAAAQQQQQQHHSHHPSFASLIGSITPNPAAGPADQQASLNSPPSPPTHADAHQLAMLMGSSLPASYMRPASLAARAVRHQVGKKSGCLGEALAEAAAVAAAAAAAVGPGSGGVTASGGPGGNEVVEHDFLDVENLLESYAIIVDTTYQTLMSIGEYIDDTEDLINIQLDFSRNKLIRFDILLTAGTFALAFFNIVTGMLGENLVLPEAITQDLSGFALVNIATLLFCITTFLSLVMVFKWQKVLRTDKQRWKPPTATLRVYLS
ncbi:hypothetical protein VOLCADRAFT_96274 [Volvox carteri f. nagariensis]|uniref:Magnesium transporter n=1 Tax=Volvox carteri f. nagariensis TaxID=3068 RepID=D8U9P1_VOLCA|nr:uncharacterized protein VOLCADRAFT_96274 [Volvox carteri f. nagariensis]EFJ43506.1 hypothetical protein VOLCADRAFT_96274 [Volvox carteri f. nagariensis]|eukprot:XP_002955435.1 hypothetical protein VOLCADRAFT_96274 [Volvox carteri f. nagariensis]